MKSKIGILVLCFFYQFCFGQILTRMPLHGQIVNDSIKIETGVVFNINSKTGTVINQQGFFSILAKVNDTLVFSSLAFKSKKMRLTQKDFSSPFLRVKLEVLAKQLVEVVVYAKKSIIPIEGNSQAIVDKQYFDDEKSSPKNRTMPPDGTIENGMNFVRMYKDILKILKINNPDRTDFITPMNFTEVVMKRISYTFFANTLKLKEDEIGLFLIFCENDSKAKTLLEPKSEFELIDFLITKNKEYKKITTFEE
ncbi:MULTISPECIES: hypothetical protein [unclassified Flavobacterium]|uniref:hypothetical protein n=1 Tax=unclassified Flavobacterium TaxID=196869 RepID=UPI0025BF6E77|nr:MULTISPECIES: hypothetical protein [unclassified Flavobacterium]